MRRGVATRLRGYAVDMSEQPETTVTADRRCAQCGYSLRTLPRRGKCPECGYSVIRSLHLPKTRSLLEVEDRILARRETIERWHWWTTIFTIVLLTLSLIAVLLILLPIIPEMHDAPEDLTYAIAVMIGGTLITGLLLGLLGLAVRAWLGVLRQHADYVNWCRTRGDSSRTADQRNRDYRIYRTINDFEYLAGTLNVLRWIVIVLLALVLILPALGTRAFTLWQIISELFALLLMGLYGVALLSAFHLVAHARHRHARSIDYYRAAGVYEASITHDAGAEDAADAKTRTIRSFGGPSSCNNTNAEGVRSSRTT
jgi:hypothetical protein